MVLCPSVSARLTRTPLWLVLCMAVMALCSVDGLHELSHWGEGGGHVAAPSGHAEVHSGQCPHRSHVPAPDHHQCLVCQQRAGQQTPVMPDVLSCADASLALLLPRDVQVLPVADCAPGVLGARGPPPLAA